MLRPMSVAAFAPATVSNVACGFDVLGFALDEPGDLVIASPSDVPGVTIVDVVGDGGKLPREPTATPPGPRRRHCSPISRRRAVWR